MSGGVFLVFLASLLAYVKAEACVQCNSATDPKCATEPKFLAKQCANATSQCYTRILDGHTIRGCASDLSNSTAARCHNEMDCLICSSNGCNGQIFPMHRPQCLQCEGGTNSSCATNAYAQAAVCPIYQLGDKCFIRQTGRNDTQSFMRGCLSSARARQLCVDERHCYTCEGSGCNNLLSNSTVIPLARDSARAGGSSLLLLLAVLGLARAFI